MERVNPYRPGAGKRPPLLAGRDEIVSIIRREMEKIDREGIGDRPFAIWGLRGVGKTALLNYAASVADERDWLVIKLEAASGDSVSRKIGQEMATLLRRYRPASQVAADAILHALRVLKSFQLKVDPTGAIALSASIEPESGYADSGNPQLDLQDLFVTLGETARNLGTAALVAIDELQEASQEDLVALNMSLHAIGQEAEPVPLLFMGAGLPALPGVLSKASTYAERLYRYFEIGLLDAQAAALALVAPSEDQGVSWSEGALDIAVAASAGYPYFIQQCGSCSWDARVGDDTINEEDARVGALVAREEVDRGLYRARWDRTTSAGKEMMIAMARLGGEVPMSDIAREMNKSKQSDLSPIRDRLISEGQIYSPARGRVAFTVPGMDDYIIRNYAE